MGPRLNQAFVEYAQARGFVIDAARVRHPQDKPRVERTVSYVRSSFFAGEMFRDLADARGRAERWCRDVAGLRVHGTTQRRPAEVFTLEEAPCLLAPPGEPYDVPIYTSAKVHRDHHIEVARALYSVPGDLIGTHVEVRADRALVRISRRGTLVKVHPRQAPGRRSTDPSDLPSEKSVYAMRDLDRLRALAEVHGHAVGTYAAALLDTPLPWTKMRQVYRLLGLVRRYGPARVEDACARALDAEAIDVSLIARMLERAVEPQTPLPGITETLSTRFARDPEHFAVARPTRRHPDTRAPRERVADRNTTPVFSSDLPEEARSSAPSPTISAELRALLRRLKLGKALDTLPERLILARTNQLAHAEFLELILADEVSRRDVASAGTRAHAARLEATMTWNAGTTPPPSTSIRRCGPSSPPCGSSRMPPTC